MNILKSFTLAFFIIIPSLIFSDGLNMDNFKLSSYTLKSYDTNGLVKNEATYSNDHTFLGVYTYNYTEDEKIEKVEYFSSTAINPTYKIYVYLENGSLDQIEAYSDKSTLISTTKYFYENDQEIKREYFDKHNKLQSILVNRYDDGNLKVRADYYDKNKKPLQTYVYKYNDDGKQTIVGIYKSSKLTKSYFTSYNDDGSIKYIYYQNSDGRITQLFIHKYDENNRLIELRKYIPK